MQMARISSSRVLCDFGAASNPQMVFFREHWEQTTRRRCLSRSLSGNGQNFLTARIPAPGGDQ